MNRQILVFALLGILLSACSSTDLTRDQAESLISESKDFLFLKQKIWLHTDGIKKGRSQQMWTSKYNLTPKGAKYLSSVGSQAMMLKGSVKTPSIMVTGIANLDSLDVKEVEFAWEYQGVPAIIRRFSVLGGTGEAIFRQYDDGWRIEKIKNLSTSDTPARMSTAELAEEQDEIQKIQEAIKIAEEKRAKYIAKSKVPTKTISSYKHWSYASFKQSPSGRMDNLQVTITDVNLDMQRPSGNITIWFGWIGEVRGSKFLLKNVKSPIVGKKGGKLYGNSITVNIQSKEEREKFQHQLVTALTAWRSKYPDL